MYVRCNYREEKTRTNGTPYFYLEADISIITERCLEKLPLKLLLRSFEERNGSISLTYSRSNIIAM